jgi:hypothetical protein
MKLELARTDAWVYYDRACLSETKRYRLFVAWFDDDSRKIPYTTEELDVDAASKDDAKLIGEAALAKDYEPGGKVIKVEGPMTGIYL